MTKDKGDVPDKSPDDYDYYLVHYSCEKCDYEERNQPMEQGYCPECGGSLRPIL